MQFNIFNAAECNSMQLITFHASASLGEAARRAKRAPSASRTLLHSLHAMRGVRDMLAAAVLCRSSLRCVPKLIKFRARFPFFVRQVSKMMLKRVHLCKVVKIRVAYVGPC